MQIKIDIVSVQFKEMMESKALMNIVEITQNKPRFQLKPYIGLYLKKLSSGS